MVPIPDYGVKRRTLKVKKPSNTLSTIAGRVLAVFTVLVMAAPVPQEANADLDRLKRQAEDAKEDIKRDKEDAKDDAKREKKDAKGDLKREKKDAKGDLKREKKDGKGDLKRDLKH
jgi:F0F1-type ATP synthase membrane subunit b/b'